MVSFVLTLITIVIYAKLTGYEPTNLTLISIAVIVSALFYIALGTLLGLLTKSVVEASVLILPVLFIFGFGTMFLGLVEKYPVLVFIEYLPNIQLIEFANKVQAGSGIVEVWMHVGIISAWFVGAAIITSILFKKRKMDE